MQRREVLERQKENALRLATQRPQFALKRLEEEQALQLNGRRKPTKTCGSKDYRTRAD